MNSWVGPRDVAGIEVYSNEASAPLAAQAPKTRSKVCSSVMLGWGDIAGWV